MSLICSLYLLFGAHRFFARLKLVDIALSFPERLVWLSTGERMLHEEYGSSIENNISITLLNQQELQ
jgi:hypothetical protein